MSDRERKGVPEHRSNVLKGQSKTQFVLKMSYVADGMLKSKN